VSPQLNDLPNVKACQIFFMNEITQEITRQKNEKSLPKNQEIPPKK
jgi:hypothetical protein